MTTHRFVSDGTTGTVRVGTTDNGEPELAEFTDGVYSTDNTEHAAALRGLSGVTEGQDAPLTPDLVDVRLPGAQVIVPGAPRAGAGVAVAIPTDGDRSDGGELAGQIVTGENARTLKGLLSAQPDAAETAQGVDATGGEAVADKPEQTQATTRARSSAAKS